jgi:hypothetical protein
MIAGYAKVTPISAVASRIIQTNFSNSIYSKKKKKNPDLYPFPSRNSHQGP